MSAASLAAEVAAVDAHLTVEWVDGVCVLHGPADRSVPVSAEVQAMRLIAAETPQFVYRADLEPAV